MQQAFIWCVIAILVSGIRCTRVRLMPYTCLPYAVHVSALCRTPTSKGMYGCCVHVVGLLFPFHRQ